MPKINQVKDPAFFEVTKPDRAPSKLVLGMDLGTSTGYCYSHFSPGMEPAKSIFPTHMGQWDLSAGPYDSGAIRFVRLRHFLSALKPDLIFYEDVKNVAGMPKPNKFNLTAIMARAATSAELLGAFRATVCTWAEENGVPCTGFGVGVIKKRATGKGNSGKEGVIAACNELFGSELPVEGYETSGVDNIADSAFVLLLGLEQYGAGIPFNNLVEESP